MGGAKKIVWPSKELDFLREYGLRDLYLKGDYRSVLRIGNETADYALKCVQHSDKKLLSLINAQKFLELRGFANFSKIIPNEKGEYFTPTENGTYFLIEWINGRESNFTNHDELLTYISVVAKMHALTHGFGVTETDLRAKWSAKLQKVQEISKGQYAVPDKFFVHLSQVIDFGQKALSLLQNQAVFSCTYQPIVVCHKDLTYRNLLIDQNNDGYLIDFDYAKADVATRDLAQFLRKVWDWNNWDIDLGLRLLAAYSKVNPLSKGELGVLLAWLYFPRSFRQLKSRLEKYNSDPAMLAEIVKDIEDYLDAKPSLDRFARSLGY